MLRTDLKALPEMEKLLAKYKGGHIPPLATRSDEKLDGLLGEELLEIFREGFSAIFAIPLSISIVSGNHGGSRFKNGGAESRIPYVTSVLEDLSYQELSDLLTSCRCFRAIKKKNANQEKRHEEDSETLSFGLLPKNQLCGYCLQIPSLIPSHKDVKARAHMCYVGMISLLAPVYVAGEIVAVLSTGCKKPEAGAIWPSGLVEQNARLSDVAKPSSATKTNLWQETQNRIRKCEEILGLESGELSMELAEKLRIDPGIEASPEDLENIVAGLENAGRHLSDLADKTYRLEKESVISWLRAEMASALSSSDGFWAKIQWCFGNLAQFMGVDYILLISRDRSHLGSFNLQCQYGLQQESLPAIQYDWAGSRARVADFVAKVNTFETIREIDLREYRDLPILSMLYDLYGKGVKYPVLIVPTTNMEGGLTFMVLGKTKPRAIAAKEWLKEDDQQRLMTVVSELAIITNVFFSMERLQKTVEAQTNLMESVAHDLRTPIQNIMIAAENLRECRVAPERASRTIAGLVTQLQRLNLLAQKAWTLERIRLNKMVYDDEQMVNPYMIFVECRGLLTDMAGRASIEIQIDPDVEGWRAIHVDAEMFRLVVLNLLHNAIKYSFPKTYIKIGGWQDDAGTGATMTFENKGIAIHDEEKDRIFERYFRSKDAIKMDPAGSGIGLVLVKEFVDHYNGRIDVRSAEVGFGEYLNVFSLFLPGR